MSTATVSGRVSVIEETKTFGQRGFRKRLVVLEQPGSRFTNHIPVEFVQDGCDSVDELNVGDNVEITYRLSGRKWQRDPQSEVKYFLSAEALSFNVLNSGGPAEGGAPMPDESEAAFSDDDIPF